MNCNPQVLANAARCFKTCGSPIDIQAIKSYILCRVATVGLGARPVAPTGFSITLAGDGSTVNGSWNAPPAGVTATRVYKSSDGVNYSLYSTIAAPGTTGTDVASTNPVGSIGYYKIAWVAGTLEGPQTAPLMASGRVSDWAHRVIVNGGAALSAGTMAAMNTFDLALMAAAGVSTNLISLLTFVPDNLTAAITPLYKLFGNDPWTNHSFVAGDLGVNGLLGDGASKYLDTGLIPSVIFPTATTPQEAGISFYITDATNINCGEFGALGGANLYLLADNASANSVANCYNGVENTSQLTVSNSLFKGFLSMSRTSVTRLDIYSAHGTLPFSSIGHTTGSIITGGTTLAAPLFCFGLNISGPTNYLAKHMSFAALHYGFSSAQTQSLFNAVQSFRVALGGGWI